MKSIILITILCFINLHYSNSQEYISVDQSEMAKSINTYRTSNGKPLLNLSFALCKVAGTKAKSLQENGQTVNLTGYLADGIDKMIYLKVKGIDANSQNTVPTLTMKNAALEFWKVILEEESYAGKNWKSFGTGFYQNYVVLWFSDKLLNDNPVVGGNENLNTQTEIVIGPNKDLPEIKNGKWLVAPTYFKMGSGLDNNLYPVANDSEKWGFINLKGEVVIPFQFDYAYGFSEGLAPVQIDGNYGYINESGEFEISPVYSSAGYFYKGKALINQNELDYLIDTKGEKITAGSADMAMLNDGYIAFNKGGLYGIKDLSGKILKSPFMTDFFGYSEGLAAVKIQGKWGFMDESFNIVIKPQYTEKLIYAFHDGYARFKQNNKVGLIDKTGKVVLNAQYDDLYEYSEGLMAFSQGGKWGYINLNGEVVIPPQYFSAENFKNGTAKVKTGPLICHLIDQNNDRIISNVNDLKVFSNNVIGVDAKNGWGLVQLNK